MVEWLAPILEAAAVLLYAGAWLDVRRTDPGGARALVTAAVYGLTLEAANIALFGTYHYPDVYVLRIATVPIYIALLWAVILHSSLAITDRLGLARWARPFADGLIALLMDLAVDAVAIRLGLWEWRSPLEGNRRLAFDEGWFGVPPGNLTAWMWVAASYGYFRRALDAAGDRRRWGIAREAAVVLLSYAGLFAGIFLSAVVRRPFGIETQTGRLWILAGQAAVFLVIASCGVPRSTSQVPREPGAGTRGTWNLERGTPLPTSYVVARWSIHLSFAILLLGTGIWRSTPSLLAVSAGTILLEALVGRAARRSLSTASAPIRPT